jgi:adenylate cyclase
MQQRNELRLLRRDLAKANEQLDFLLRHYVPSEVADALLEQRLLPQPGGELCTVSILFADLRGYTRTSEQLTAYQTIELLNGYLNTASEAIAEAGGTVTQYAGDQVMAIFNAPNDQPDHAWRAVEAGLAVQKSTAVYQDQTAPDLPRLHFGVGINSGPAVVGNIGARWRYNYSAIGDTTNVAARICSAARAQEILIGPATYEQVKERVTVSVATPMRFKGKSHPISVYQVLPPKKADEEDPQR